MTKQELEKWLDERKVHYRYDDGFMIVDTFMRVPLYVYNAMQFTPMREFRTYDMELITTLVEFCVTPVKHRGVGL